MGLFDFAKKVGAKIFGASEAKAAAPEDLKKEAAKHGLDTSGMDVKVEGDKVVLTGNVMSMEEAEKIILAVGNTIGVAQVESQLSMPDAKEFSKMYTVGKGDTLWKIAETNYGKGKGGEYNKIFEANRPMLSHPDKIYPGQVLRIPPL